MTYEKSTFPQESGVKFRAAKEALGVLGFLSAMNPDSVCRTHMDILGCLCKYLKNTTSEYHGYLGWRLEGRGTPVLLLEQEGSQRKTHRHGRQLRTDYCDY